MTLPIANIEVLYPLMFACAWGLLVLTVEMFSLSRRFVGIGWLSALGLAAVAGISLSGQGAGEVFAGAVALDAFSVYFYVLLSVLAIFAVFLSMDYVPLAGIIHGEFYPLILFAVAGLLVMVSATDLIVMFLGLETMSMAVYVLAGIRKDELRSNEAALKYFLLGAFASALLLYGIALIYAITGSTVLGSVANAIASTDYLAADSLVLMLGVGMLLAGFAFKIAAVPFHLWTPDVYEGAPTTVSAFMATAVKAGAFAALLRIVLVALAPVMPDLSWLMWVLAASTMTMGNFVALRQTNVKRMLAYSSIAHTGYLLVGVTAATAEAGAAVLYYLAAYGVMNIGAFGVLAALTRRRHALQEISDFAGLGQNRPVLALVMSICMLSLMGMPPLAGFVGKFYLFTAALEAGYTVLVVIAVLNSVVSAAYYLGVLRAMYFQSADAEEYSPRPYLNFAVTAAAAVTVALGLAPSPVMGAASRAFSSIILGP